MDIEHTLRL